MPWCEACERWFGPAALGAGRTCPACGRPVAADPGPAPSGGSPPEAGHAELRPVAGAPWHFKLLLAALAVYLGFRFWQLLAWVIAHL